MRYVLINTILLLIHVYTNAQYSRIDQNLNKILAISPDSAHHSVIISFKGEKFFTADEINSMRSMPESNMQSYYLRILKSRVSEKQAKVLNLINSLSGTGKVKLRANLWAANAISISAVKEVIYNISLDEEVENIRLINKIPADQLHNDTMQKVTTQMTISSIDTSWGVLKIKAPGLESWISRSEYRSCNN